MVERKNPARHLVALPFSAILSLDSIEIIGVHAYQLSQGDSPLTSLLPRSRFRLGMVAIVAIFALRIAAGWLFFTAGRDKVFTDWSARGFLANAKGPLAPMYRGMVFDPDGKIRLTFDHERDDNEKLNDPAVVSFDYFGQDAATHFGFDDGQLKKSDNVYNFYSNALEEWHYLNEGEIREYFLALERSQKYAARPDLQEVTSLDGQASTVVGDARKLGAPLMNQVDLLFANYERDINAIATEDQMAASGYYEFKHIDEPAFGLHCIDPFIPWFDIVVGGLLIVGLFVRPAAILGGLFLLSVVLSQWPWAYDAADTIYQTNLMFTMFALAAVGAGRFLGLDYLIHAMWASRTKPASKTGDNQ